MAKILERLSADGPALWLDDSDYSERLLANGRTPWGDVAEYVAYRRKAHGLLRPDFVVLPLGRFADAHVAADAALRDAMAAKKRAVVPARTLLADEAWRAHLTELLKAMRAAFGSAPLVLALPSPRALVAQAYRLAFGPDAQVEVGGDEADACAVYVADFLSAFGESGVDGVLLEEAEGAEPAASEEIAWYQPVLNLAAHYRWDLGLRLPSAAGFSGPAEGVQFVIAPTAIVGAANGLALGAGFWNGDAPAAVPSGGFRYACVPPDAVPENVLERLATLRA